MMLARFDNLRLARAFPNTAPEFWLNLQRSYDLWHAIQRSQDWQQVRSLIGQLADSPA